MRFGLEGGGMYFFGRAHSFLFFFFWWGRAIFGILRYVKKITLLLSRPLIAALPWVRKNGNLSMREILVKASGIARGRVRLRRTAY